MDQDAVTMYTLGPVDYMILALTLVISASIGIYYRFSGGKQKSTGVSLFLV